MAKKELDKNFENLKAQMIKKKNMAKTQDNIQSETVENIQAVDFENKTEDENKSLSPKIVIKKQEKADIPKRITYYLNNSTIKKIDKSSKIAGMGKSAFVQTLLDIALENLEIE